MAYFCRFRWLPFEGINFLQDRPPRFVLKSPFYIESKIFYPKPPRFQKKCPWLSVERNFNANRVLFLFSVLG